MSKSLLIILLIAVLKCSAQDYKAQIDAFRKKYTDDFLSDPSSPVKKDDLPFLRFYDADSTYRVEARVEYFSNPPTFIIPAYTGAGRQYTRYATLKFMLKGKPVQLTVYRSLALANIPAYKDYLFLPFTDETNGVTTYAGGRYIDLTVNDFKANSLTIDFNKAYNPYCAFAGGYSCPKPPDENHLAVQVEAGEKLYAGEKKHQ
jgi:uncharacterized protein (DUF1684 family)